MTSSKSSFFCLFFFRISSPWIPAAFHKEDRIQTCRVLHEPHNVCLISSNKLPRNKVLQHGRVISTYEDLYEDDLNLPRPRPIVYKTIPHPVTASVTSAATPMTSHYGLTSHHLITDHMFHPWSRHALHALLKADWQNQSHRRWGMAKERVQTKDCYHTVSVTHLICNDGTEVPRSSHSLVSWLLQKNVAKTYNHFIRLPFPALQLKEANRG